MRIQRGSAHSAEVERSSRALEVVGEAPEVRAGTAPASDRVEAAPRAAVHATQPADAHALTTALFLEHGRYVCRVLRRMGVAERDLDDVCQEVFVTVHRGLASFEGRSSHKTWVYGICMRSVANYRRRAFRRYEQSSSVLPEVASREQADGGVLERDLDRALATLTEAKREVFVLYELGQLEMHEVAEVLGCPLKTCFSRLHAARTELRAWFAHEVSP